MEGCSWETDEAFAAAPREQKQNRDRVLKAYINWTTPLLQGPQQSPISWSGIDKEIGRQTDR